MLNKNNDKYFNRKKYGYLLITIFIGFLLIAPEDVLFAKDRMNYMIYASSGWQIVQRYLSSGILPFLSNEPLFLLINIVLSYVFSSENIIRIIIFSSVFGILYSLGKLSKYNYFILFFFLFLPQMLINSIIHLRQGLALSVYLLGLTSDKKQWKILRYMSIFIHTSCAFLVLFEILENFLKKIKANFESKLILVSCFLTVFIVFVPILALILQDRRALEYNFLVAVGSNGLGFLVWFVMGIFFIIFIKKDDVSLIACYGIVFYLISYFLLDFGARVFENIIPLILVSTLNEVRNEIKIIYILFWLFYGGLQWYLGGWNFWV